MNYYGLIQEKHGGFSNIDPATATPSLWPGSALPTDYNNVAPRVSVAWDVTGHQKTVVRAGFGIFSMLIPRTVRRSLAINSCLRSRTRI